ncbi:unnamed protein product, partial [Coregonus sp. 'balchen']
YGFIRPVNWEEVQFEETTGISNDEDFTGEEDFLSGIQEGDSSLSRAETDDEDDGEDEDSPNPTESQAFISALREFQKVSGLSVTGVFDDATKVAMNKPRPHQSPPTTATDRPHQHQSRLVSLLSKRRQKRHVRRHAWGNMAFSKMVLKWRLIGEGYSSQLTIQDQRHIISLAFRMWSEVSPLEFGDTWDATRSLMVLDGSLPMHGSWETFTLMTTNISLHRTLAVGSACSKTGSIMQPSYLPQESGFEINWMDRKAIQHLYGGCKGQFNTVFDWIRKERTQYGEVVIRFNTYFMRDGWYWLYENRTNRTRYGDPVALQVGWHGIPTDGVDACVHVWNRNTDAVYFFKVDPEGHRYPRLISEGFPGVPSPIDTAFYDRRDSYIYFFKGTNVYALDVTANSLAPGFPRKITAVFPAVVPGDHPGGNIDASYFSYTHNAVFLFKDAQFWRVAAAGRRSRDGWRRPSLPHNGLMPHREVGEQWFDICNVHPSALKVARR